MVWGVPANYDFMAWGAAQGVEQVMWGVMVSGCGGVASG